MVRRRGIHRSELRVPAKVSASLLARYFLLCGGVGSIEDLWGHIVKSGDGGVGIASGYGECLFDVGG